MNSFNLYSTLDSKLFNVTAVEQIIISNRLLEGSLRMFGSWLQAASYDLRKSRSERSGDAGERICSDLNFSNSNRPD